METQALPGISEDLFSDTGLRKKLLASFRYSISLHYYLFLNYKEVPKPHFSALLYSFIGYHSSLIFLTSSPPYNLKVSQPCFPPSPWAWNSQVFGLLPAWNNSPALVQCHSSPYQISTLQERAVADRSMTRDNESHYIMIKKSVSLSRGYSNCKYMYPTSEQLHILSKY